MKWIVYQAGENHSASTQHMNTTWVAHGFHVGFIWRIHGYHVGCYINMYELFMSWTWAVIVIIIITSLLYLLAISFKTKFKKFVLRKNYTSQNKIRSNTEMCCVSRETILHQPSCKSVCAVRQFGRHEQTMSQNVQKCQNYRIWWVYLESPWEMHLNKYKHAWYWFRNLWNFANLGNKTILYSTAHEYNMNYTWVPHGLDMDDTWVSHRMLYKYVWATYLQIFLEVLYCPHQ